VIWPHVEEDGLLRGSIHTWRLDHSQQTCTISPLTTDPVATSTVDGAMCPTSLASMPLKWWLLPTTIRGLSMRIKVGTMGIWIQTGQEAFYWTIASVWTIALTAMEFIQHLVMLRIVIIVSLDLHLTSTVLTITTLIVIHFPQTLTTLWSVAGMTANCQVPYQQLLGVFRWQLPFMCAKQNK
jgi:hypothetical protein